MKTIIVRLFEPAPGTGPVSLHGVMEDVRTGQTAPFHGDAQLVAAIARVLQDHAEGGPDPDDPRAESP